MHTEASKLIASNAGTIRFFFTADVIRINGPFQSLEGEQIMKALRAWGELQALAGRATRLQAISVEGVLYRDVEGFVVLSGTDGPRWAVKWYDGTYTDLSAIRIIESAVVVGV